MTAALGPLETDTPNVVSADFSPSGPGIATQLVFANTPVAGASQSPFTTMPVLKVEDSADNVVTTSTITVGTPTVSGNGVLSGCANLTAVTGVIDMTGCTLEGTVNTDYTMTVPASGLTSAVFTPLIPTGPGPATQIFLSGCSTSIAWNSACTASATLEDVVGNVETSYDSPITFSQVSSSGGAVSGLESPTAASGVASDTLNGSSVGSLVIDATADGYTFASNSITVTVTGAPLTVTAGSGTITYGHSFTPSFTPIGLKGSDAISSVTYTYAGTGSTIYGPSTTQPTAAGTYSVTPSAAVFSSGSASDYTITYTAGTLTINQASEGTTITLNSPTTPVTYGSEASDSFTGTVTGQTNDGYPEGTVTITNGATTLCTVTLSAGAGDATNFTCTPTGTEDPAGNYTTILATYTPGTPSSSNADYTYTGSTSTIDRSQTVQTTALTVTAGSGTITYGHSFTPSFTPIGLKGSDAISSVTYTYAGTGSTIYGPSTTQPTAAGTYSVTPSAAVFSSGSASDYTITYTAGTLTINQASEGTTITLNSPTTPVTYGSEASDSFTGTVTGQTNDGYPEGTVTIANGATTLCTVTLSAGAGDATNFTCTPTGTEDPAGTYTTILATYTPGTPSSSNANYTYTGSTSTIDRSQTVQTAPLTVTAGSGTITYGHSFTPSFTPIGLKGSDAISSVTYTYAGTGSTIYGPSTTQPTAAGTYSVTPSAAVFSSGSASNYAITYTAGTLTINQLSEGTTITLNAPTTPVTYGSEASDSFTGTVTGQTNDGYPEGTVTITNGATTLCTVTLSAGAGDATNFTCTPTGTEDPAGNYTTILATYTPGTPSSSNADYTYTGSTSTIDRSQTVQTTALTVTAGSGTITYGHSFTPSFTPIGLKGSDAISSVTYTYAGTGSTIYGPSTTQPTAAGTYSVTPSAAVFSSGSASDYTITYTAGTLTINQASLTVTAANETITYGGTVASSSTVTAGLVSPNAATVTSATYTYLGIDGTTYASSTTAPTAAGTYSVTPSAAVLNFSNGSSSNYTIGTYTAGTLTINQAPEGTTITLNAPTSPVTYGSEASDSFTGTATGQTNDGYPEGTVTIKNGATTLCTVTLSAGAGDATNFTCTPTGTEDPAGTYTTILATYTPGTPSSSNASVTYSTSTSTTDRSQTVQTTALTVTAGSGTIFYGGTFTPSFTPTGLQGSDAISSVTYTFLGIDGTSYGPSTTQPTAAGTYQITPSAAVFSTGAASDYTITYDTGTLTINKMNQAALTVTSTAGIYGTALTITTSGGSDGGAVTYTVSNGTATGCAVSGSTPYTLSSTSVGTCIVTATMAGNAEYLPVSSAATTVKLLSATVLVSAASTSSASVTSTSITPTDLAPELVLVSWESTSAEGTETCDTTVTSVALSGSALIQTNTTWYTSFAPNYYQMCAYEATGTNTAGTVKVTLSGTVTDLSIQVVQINGDNAAAFELTEPGNSANASNEAPVFSLSAAAATGSLELLFGDSSSTAGGWSATTPAGFLPPLFDTAGTNFTPAEYFGGPANETIDGALTSNARWGTVGIEVVP